MDQKHKDENNLLLLFDGTCNYCNRWVDFIIRHDRKKKFRFAALQSGAGKKLMNEHNISSKEDTVVLIDNGKAYLKSSAGLRTMKHIGGLYAALYLFLIVPPFIRNYFYGILARNRYRWWGKRNACRAPAEDVKERFLN